MVETGTKGPASMGKVLGIAIVVSALVGGIVGFATSTLMRPGPPQAPQEREFTMFTIALPFNDSITPNFPVHDYFAPDRLTVYKGDTVKIHLYNTEETPEDHTFTMAAPYEMNYNVHSQELVNITFSASTAGIFTYWCAYHIPSMTGYLIVLQA